MDIEVYRNFLTIIECGTLTEAAKKILIAQPALTTQLKNLERAYGMPLLEKGRGQHGVKLTEAGELFYAKARLICHIDQDLHTDIQSLAQGITGTLKMAIALSRSSHMIKIILMDYHHAYPQVAIKMLECNMEEQEKQLLQGQAEIGVAYTPLLHPYQFDILFSRPVKFYVVCRADNSFLAGRQSVKLKDLAHTQLSLGEDCWTILAGAMAEQQLEPHIVTMSSNYQTALAWTKLGTGITLMPWETFDGKEQDLCYLPLDEDISVSKIIFKTRGSKLSSVAQHFVNYYNQNCLPGTQKFAQK